MERHQTLLAQSKLHDLQAQLLQPAPGDGPYTLADKAQRMRGLVQVQQKQPETLREQIAALSQKLRGRVPDLDLGR